MSDLFELQEKIEKLRKRLNDLALTVPLTDPEILKISQELDVLIVKYQRLLQK
ncbi:hypothetical protein P22_0768 [Propionispora sp. 2/2-37]|uniref:aspartyl-phosphate phosphatase Spo0E family protein n=1 Tax=Propionispora sp. 2/2-37 TaxID=1677858 RepID=UPI0006C13E29|nr:aspartyl-phosphate phosphatase Spo0E family protein [Propionispora sp. 2/2-37]CUH94702.1 hypothetical protein P22_0768 [Propionispora sp. 2/2-37]